MKMFGKFLSILSVIFCLSLINESHSAGSTSRQCYSDICKDGVIVGNTCYWLPYRAGPRLNYEKASDHCHFHGGVLAEIPTEEAYNAIFRYVKRSWYLESSFHRIDIWLNSEYISGQGGVFLVGGGTSYIKWFPGYPTAHANHVQMGLVVPTSSDQLLYNNGMFNIIATHTAVPLCQFSL